MKHTCLFAIVLMISSVLSANVRLPRIFADNMVLQREKPIAIWGWADPGERISVSFHGQVRKTRAARNGAWKLFLDAEPGGGPFQLKVEGRNTKIFSNVLVGEVWICSGQSNMEFMVRQANNSASEIAQADFPLIRHFKVPHDISISEKADISGGGWEVCSPATAGEFTAAGYFFARELYRQLHVPVGLINSTWGGTIIESWTSRGALENSSVFQGIVSGIPTAQQADSLVAVQKAKLETKVLQLQGSIPAPSEADQFAGTTCDDSRWPKMVLPGLWENAHMGLEELDGIVWFRKTIHVDAQDAGKPATLELGKIDDGDDSYVNGVKVGGMKQSYAENRKYRIPAGVLKAGANIIAVRVEDNGGGGGIYGEPAELQLSIGDKIISLAGPWGFRVTKIYAATSLGPNSYPTLLFNGMVNPLIPYTIKGVIWYQGEANADRAYQYREAFPLMINDWRRLWEEGDFPFYFVQLASWNAANGNSERGSTWAELREAQTMTLSLPNTGMAVTTDIGNPTNIHPTNKQDVGHRLAAIALNDLYGKSMEYSGPLYQGMVKDNKRIIISFTHCGNGLTARDPYGYLKGFEIAGADHHFHYAKAEISGDKVIVWQDGISDPVAVRYGWADDAGEANLFNANGFPASSFRTDQWPGVTESVKYMLGK